MNKIKQLLNSVKMIVKKAYMRRRRFGKVIGQVIVYVLLITTAYVFLYPFLRMVSFSLMSPKDIVNPDVSWIPLKLYFGNFKASMIALNGWEAMYNSIWFSTTLAVAQTFVSALTGYAFARYQFSFKKILFGLILLSFIIPVPIILIPRYMMFKIAQNEIGFQMINTIYPQLILGFLGQGVNSAILILIFYNFFKLIPNQLFEASRIDGANGWQQFWHITVKMSLSTIVVVFLFSFVWNWNETYVTGLLARESIELLPKQLGIFDTLFDEVQNEGGNTSGANLLSEAYKMSATFISMIPLFIIYGLAQRQFIEGIENTGITGE